MTERTGKGMSELLRLKAIDAEDLSVIAACLQDAVMPVGEMTYLPAERRFVAVIDRFTWERTGGEAGPGLCRVRAGLRFERVDAARVNRIDPEDATRVLELLTLSAEGANVISLVFAGGGAIRLEGEGMICLLEDLDEPRPAPRAPCHPLSDDAGEQ